MKKYLLPEKNNFYKANMHCHTVLSDGAKTPEEVKEIYKKLGYSIVAYTDHDLFITHNDLTDKDFLALNGFEMSIIEDRSKGGYKICHLCIVALDEKIEIQPFWHRELYFFGNAPKNKHLVKFDENEPDHIREYSGEYVSKVAKECKEKGFFVTYNHPNWSRETYLDYMNYHNLDAIEIVNGAGLLGGYEDYNSKEYDDMLTGGQKLFCIGGDDNHNRRPNTRRWDSGVAFTMIKAERLDYKSVATALKNGWFYASEGPEIYDLYYEDGKVYIKCSAVDKIYMTCRAREARVEFSEDENGLTEACFDVPHYAGYFRLTLVDKFGKRANTNAYFMEDLIK